MFEPFAQIYSERHDYARAWKERTGGKVLGYFCTYVPEEILYAADVLPVRILGSHEPQDVTEPHIFGMYCPFCRDCLAQGLKGRFDYLDGLMIAQSCLHIGLHGSLELPSGRSYEGALFKLEGRGIAVPLVTWLEAQAAQGDPHAQYFLGSALLDFEQPPADPNTAMIWLERAAEGNVAEAQYRLATLLLDDDISAAVRWLREAAAQAHPSANQVLGEYFHTGQYFPRDFSQAIRHYEIAADHGSVAASNNLAWLLATTQAPEFADPERAVKLMRPLVLYLGNWQHLDTLAAAHARLGDTELAERLQTQALIQARSVAPEHVVEEMSARLDLYASDRAYTE